MKTCETCGNTYDKAMEIKINNMVHHFDSFECAIQALAPKCAECECRIIGHGLEVDGIMFCCAHCSRGWGQNDLRDRTTVAQ